MNFKRIWRSLRLCLITSGTKRAEYLRKNEVFASMGGHGVFMLRKVPLYPKLIKLGHHVNIAPGVIFATHDAVHKIFCKNDELLVKYGMTKETAFPENLGCIEIGNNVFISANTTIMSNIRIGSNVIIGAGSIITKDIPDNSVVAGVPAKIICDFDTYINKRMNMESFPKDLAPVRQETSPQLDEWCWKKFEEQRK